MGHARLAPSSAGRWCFCPGSVTMEERYPEGDKDEASAGEASHWVASEVLSSGLVHAAGERAPNGVVLDMEMIDGAFTYARTISYSDGMEWGRTPLFIEQTMAIPSVHPECWGTPDTWYFLPHRAELHVWDYKFGWLIIEPTENRQLICYALGALAQLESQYLDYTGLTVVIHIVQPRPQHCMGPHREWRVRAADLHTYAEQLRAAAYEALAPNPRICSGSHCRYCLARHACPAARKAGYAAYDYVERASIHELSPEELGLELAALERAEEAIKYLKTGITHQAVSLINNGVIVPGWTLERGQGRSTWITPPEELFIIGDLCGVNIRKPAEAKTPHQARTAGLPAEVVSAHSTSPLGDPKLVRMENSLTAQVFGAAAAARAITAA